MDNLAEEDQIAMGIFSVLFTGGGAVLRVMGMGFYWMAILIGFLLGAAVLLSKFWEKRRKREKRKRRKKKSSSARHVTSTNEG